MKRLLAFFRAADLPFGKDDANRFLPWIIAFMVFSTGIILAGWLSINGMISGSRNTQMNAFTVHLADELRNTGIKVNSAHPGWVKTDMGGENAPVEVADGALTSVRLATLPADGPTGGYFHMDDTLPW